jgi:hypothetical protein
MEIAPTAALISTLVSSIAGYIVQLCARSAKKEQERLGQLYLLKFNEL